MTKNRFCLMLWLCLLALVACGPARHASTQAPTEETTCLTLADSIWVYSQTHPDGFTINIRTWDEPKEGVAVAYSATQNCHDRVDLDFVVTHAKANGGYVGGWLDTYTGSYYFDSVRIFSEDSLEYAIQFGRDNGQIAVFILSKGQELRVK